MNLNTKFKRITIDGIPEYNQAINQLSAAVEWLLGVRTINGRPVRESDQGPVIDLSVANMTQAGAQPWMTTPDGQPAGWVQHDVCVNGQVVSKWFWGQTT